MTTTAAPDWPPPGTWVAASRALLRPVPLDEPYPHTHGVTVRAGTVSGRPQRIDRRDCPACAERGQR